MASVDVLPIRRPESGDQALIDKTEIDMLIRRFFEQSRIEPTVSPLVATPEPTVKATGPRRDFDMACELLERVAQAFDILVNRCQRLEHDLDEASKRLKAQAVEGGLKPGHSPATSSGIHALGFGVRLSTKALQRISF